MPVGILARASKDPRLVLATSVLMILSATSPAWAWGRIGHRVIARCAETQLSPNAKAGLVALLKPGESLADASTWADEHRRELPKSAPWHYVDVPLDEPRYHSIFAGDTPERGYVVDKIHDFKVVVNDSSHSLEDRRVALRFLVHFVEDLHMPMHVGDNNDKGGNRTQVRFFERGTNMHSLWDSGMIEYICDTEDFWLKDLAVLDTPPAREKATKGTIEDWATESLMASRQAYVIPETGKRLKSGQKLGDVYLDANLPVLRQRLYLASVRLAMVLNQVFAAE
jgi:nuclease S1